jgi:signal transduction histidine kinase
VLFGPEGAVLARNALSRNLLGNDDELLQLDTPASVEGWQDPAGRPLSPSAHPAALARSASGPVTWELSLPRPDGARRRVRVSASVVADPATPGEVVMALSDITDTDAAQADLERANEELRRVATVTSHDLGVPLALLRRELALIEAAQLTEPAAEGLRAAQAAADVMREIVEAVLSYAHVDGELIDDDPVDLAATAAELVTMLRWRLQETGATVRIEELPPVTGSPVLLRQLLQNLVGNAIVHHPGPAPHVVIRSEVRAGTPVIIVEDDGDGIPESQRESVFGLFTRGKSSAAGQGIGLSAAKRIVERHGGRIWIEDAEPRGARFCMTL